MKKLTKSEAKRCFRLEYDLKNRPFTLEFIEDNPRQAKFQTAVDTIVHGEWLKIERISDLIWNVTICGHHFEAVTGPTEMTLIEFKDE